MAPARAASGEGGPGSGGEGVCPGRNLPPGRLAVNHAARHWTLADPPAESWKGTAVNLVAGSYLGGYEILEQVGHARMATEYRAQRPGQPGLVAVKVVPAYFAEDHLFNDRYRDALTLTKLRHPNLLTVLDYGEGHGVAYLVTQYLGGLPLAERLARPWSLDDAIAVLAPVAAALDYVHAQQMVHRDVKPTNILIAPDGRPVLGDLGLADIVDRARRVADTGELIGTPAYMAPEQANKEQATSRTDQYALAVVAYEMLTGRVPFRGATPRDVVLAHRDQAPPRPRSLNPELPAATEEALLKGLAKRPQDRYPTVTALVDALRGAGQRMPLREGRATIVDDPAVMPVVLPVAPPEKPAAKRGALVAAAAAGVLLVAALAGGYGLSHRPPALAAAAPAATAVAQTTTATVAVTARATTATTQIAAAPASLQCRIAPIFATLIAALGDQAPVGACTEEVGLNPSNGDTVQHTTRGLLAMSKVNNVLSFTDGYQSWVLGTDGKVHHRLNTQRFPWEANPEGLPPAQ